MAKISTSLLLAKWDLMIIRTDCEMPSFGQACSIPIPTNLNAK